jgi:hypothetical protein
MFVDSGASLCLQTSKARFDPGIYISLHVPVLVKDIDIKVLGFGVVTRILVYL